MVTAARTAETDADLLAEMRSISEQQHSKPPRLRRREVTLADGDVLGKVVLEP